MVVAVPKVSPQANFEKVDLLLLFLIDSLKRMPRRDAVAEESERVP